MTGKNILVAVTATNHVPEFKITNTKLYVSVVTLSTQDIPKLLMVLLYSSYVILFYEISFY